MGQLHEREKLVREARCGLTEKIIEWMKVWGEQLTAGEELSIVGGELGNFIARTAKYQIRRERHGDEDKPGGLA